MTVMKVEQDPALELAPEAGAEELSPPLSSCDEEDDDEDEETDSEGNGGGGEPPLKKGPWTPEEDKRLKDYVEAHGEGNWNQVQRNAGLNRCGKSCRLRWANHLRPDLKKGPFDAEEVEKIIKFHIMWGNKWAKMASHLPGRTDNEIKNYWNTRLKRHQRAGLPIYPEYLLSRVPDQDMNCHTPDESRGKKRSNELPQEKVVGMDDLVGDFMVFQHLDYGKDPVVPTNPLKRHASTGDLSSVQITVNTEKTFYSNDLNYVLTKSQSMPLGCAIASGYPIFDGNLSTSGTIHGSMKTELPSFQCSKDDLSNGWLLQCPWASIEQQIDTFIQSPESMSSHNTGLLGTIINKGDVLDDPTKFERIFEMAVPLGYNIVSQSDDYPTRHPSSSVNGDCEPDTCLFTEIQDSNSPSGDANFSVAGMPGTSLEASFLNDDSLLSKDHSYLYPSGSLFDEESCEEPKPLIYAGQWFDSTAWKSVPGACNMPDFPGP
ncbi:hypothetical protein PAHAL_4G088700 [Panicum hallii]|uniref:Transcription factor n=2 Tax=Panicum hallii TaxID=206008 RepID=A0A2S3HID2_9POAL|nr:transcription factor GAMYB-like isoform X3 [Panicum hallii]PAN23402.1 hypothetical protein PAHAL_4G088700 [Panicum hallii]